MIKSIVIPLFFLLLSGAASFAQSSQSVIKGKVSNIKGEPLAYAVVALIEQSSGFVVQSCSVSESGTFKMTTKKRGKYTISTNLIGHKTSKIEDVILDSHQDNSYNFVLDEDVIQMKGVEILALSENEKMSRLAYNVEILDVKKYKNTSMNLSNVLDRASGVKIRDNGGLGADVSISVNGFSGRHIKMFIDGVPMEGMGSAFGANNIPANLAKRIEVYKGVVPIWLGGDALGGAINIVTDRSIGTRVNASYSYGSFNTHKSNLSAEHTTKSGIYSALNIYQNYSDNNYKVDARILDLETGQYSEQTQVVRRFHGQYDNQTAIAKVGVVNKSFADKLIFGFTYGDVYKETQNASDMHFVYGERYTTSQTLMPAINYEKKVDVLNGLTFSLNGNYNYGSSFASDAATRNYNWLGEYKEKSPNASPGELSYMKYNYKNNNAAGNFNVGFYPADNHAIFFSSTLTSFSRKGYDEVNPSERDDDAQVSVKNTSGLSYKYDYKGVWNTSIFAKNYMNHMKGYMDPDGDEGPLEYDNYSGTNSYWGGGLATTLFLTTATQLKLSYEHTYRLPTSRELFGSGDGLESGSNRLKPESSDNINLGVSVMLVNNETNKLFVDGSIYYRNTQDYIRRTINQTQGIASSANEGEVVGYGIDFSTRYDYKDLFFIGGNFSYQDIRNMAFYQSGTTIESTIYQDRVPNEPYLYGNADIGVNVHNFIKRGALLNIHYMMNYIHSFYFDWPSYGGITIPDQISHDIYVSYNLGQNHSNYTFTVECRNILDEKLYDNYSLQKPGRAFSLKLSYSFNK